MLTLRIPLRTLFAGLLLVALVLAVYFPALSGEPVWDDAAHLTRPDLRGTDGLARIWFELGATQQYYPVLHSAFWLQHRLWGEAVLGYHVVNVLLHAAGALLFVALLRRLAVPGAWLAGLLFALHPVHVESVAWMTELKNTLSLCFLLLAAHGYLRYQKAPSTRRYALATAAFVLALLSKTVTATLPAALLVLLWWRDGSLRRRDVVPLVPWLVLGVGAGLLTAWVERVVLGADGAAYALSFGQRLVRAGRVPWFYLGKLLWPAELVFIYPRWTPDPRGAVWILGVVATLAALGLAWAVRARTRTPLAVALLFGGTLFPVLGFLNVYPFLYSFVADHFQYAASLAPIALGAALAHRALVRWPRAGRTGAAVVIAALATLTARQAGLYRTSAGLYEHVLARHPACWMAHNNLGLLRQAAGQTTDAERHFRAAVELRPDWAGAVGNLGELLRQTGRIAEAEASLRRAADLDPAGVQARHNLATLLRETGRAAEARSWAFAVVLRQPGLASGWVGLAAVHAALGDFGAAVRHLRQARALDPGLPEADINLTAALAAAGRSAEAIAHGRGSTTRHPRSAAAWNQWGNALMAAREAREAATAYEQAIHLDPAHAEARHNLAVALHAGGRSREALDAAAQALRLRPDVPETHLLMALAARELGDPAAAQVHWQNARKLRPSLPPELPR